MNRPCKNATRPAAKIVTKAEPAGEGLGPATFDGRENLGAKPREQVGKKPTGGKGQPAQATRLT